MNKTKAAKSILIADINNWHDLPRRGQNQPLNRPLNRPYTLLSSLNLTVSSTPLLAVIPVQLQRSEGGRCWPGQRPSVPTSMCFVMISTESWCCATDVGDWGRITVRTALKSTTALIQTRLWVCVPIDSYLLARVQSPGVISTLPWVNCPSSIDVRSVRC